MEISVLNYGYPIPADQQAQIFNRFYRIENSSERQGWGIGLSLVKAIAEAHGGSILVDSSTSHGTRFTITIPEY